MKTGDFNYYENLEELFGPLSGSGAFLVVNDKNGKANTMTIGWATVGLTWYRPVINVLVRKARYTHELMENNRNFTVCVPKSGELKDALMICGSRSGRKIDKIGECKLSTEKGKLENTTIITGCNLFYECTRIHKNEVNAAELDKKIIGEFYGDRDFHTVYSGEIMHSYKKI